MLTVDPKNTKTADLHQYLLGAVSPRPIAFASTISEDGTPNLAPYSFFNCFSSNPPIVIFSSNRRVRNNTTKDTLANVEANKEVVINVVSHSIVQQMAVASIEYPSDVSEFDKAGLTPLAAEKVKPFRVAESPVQMECIVREIIPLAETPGAGNLIVCEVVLMHIHEAVLDQEGKIDPQRIDLMGRMGRAFYCRASGDAVHKIFQPVTQLGIGADQLPQAIRNSHILSGNDIGQLAALEQLPNEADIAAARSSDAVKRLAESMSGETLLEHIHRSAKQKIKEGDVAGALALLSAFA